MHELSIKLKADIEDENELWHAFWSLLGFLRHSGQLIGRNMHPYRKNNEMFATIFTATEAALEEKYHNKYVLESIRSLEEICGNPLIIRHVGFSEGEQKQVCSCTKHEHFLLYYYGDFSPVICGSCEKGVPLFLLPDLYDFGFYPLTSWQSAYQGCVLLDLNCGTGEKWAMKQQCDPRSGLSKQGREVAAKIMAETGVKTYYFLSNFSKRSKIKDRTRPCPSCGGAWHLEKEIHGYVRHKCDTCLLMSAYSNSN
jgi:predicted  nucleic acid-binding Zn ribbon protein